jgi:hypothetical protein
VYFDDATWDVRSFVVRTGGWLRPRRVLIAPSLVRGVDRAREALEVRLSRDEVEASPPSRTETPVSRRHEELYHRDDDLAASWQGVSREDTAHAPWEVAPIVVPPLDARTPGQPHLRSSAEVTGYGLHACDGPIGRVVDLLIGEPDWGVRFLEVDTRRWLPGRHVLIAPAWVGRISRADREIFLEIDRERIASAPEYDADAPFGPDDEIDLFRHYGRSGAGDEQASSATEPAQHERRTT